MSNLFSNILSRTVYVNSQQVRFIPRWSHRRPAQVIPADEYDKTADFRVKASVSSPVQNNKVDFVKATQDYKKVNWKQPENNKLNDISNVKKESLQNRLKSTKDLKPLTITKSNINSKKSKQTVDMLEATVDNEGNLIYTKMKNNDTRISNILVDLKIKKEDEKETILLEGKRIIKDALNAGCKLNYILFSRLKEIEYLKPFLPKIGARLYKMPYKEMQVWSDLTTNPGIMGVFKMPNLENFVQHHTLPVTIICDNIREPNNLGAILRTCSGVGCKEVILTKGCVNVWDSKVIRSASGAHFKLCLKRRLDWKDIEEHISPISDIYIADNNIVSSLKSSNTSSIEEVENLVQHLPVLPYYSIDYNTTKNIVLIIGGETEGISEDSYKLASKYKGARLNVPLSNDVESLNTGTALGIIAFEIKRQLIIAENCVKSVAEK